MKRYYDIHGLLKFTIEGDEEKIAYLCAQCAYFLSDAPFEDSDLDIKIGPFEDDASRKDCRIVNRKYYVGENSVYAEDSYKTARWKLRLEDLDGKTTRLLFDGNGWTKYILHKSFVEALLRYRLNRKGYFMAHSSSVSVEGRGVVFPASPEAGKTSTMLNYLERGQGFMSDDFSLVGRGAVYAYPTPITLHSHNLKRHAFLSSALSADDKRQIAWRTMVLKMTFGMGDISYKVDIWNRLEGCGVTARAPLDAMIMLTKYGGESVRVLDVAKREMKERLMVVNYYETVLFNGYLQAYYYGNPPEENADFWGLMRKNLDLILDKDSYAEILIPARYADEEFRQVAEIVEKMTILNIGGGSGKP